ncbi:MAG: hypothetical protein ACI9FR_001123 [Cryomorphaceae bacterium]|jgi:hypothetical protein
MVLKILISVLGKFGSKPSANLVLLSTLLCLNACTTFEYHETKTVEVAKINAKQEAQMSEDELLDIGVVLFDDGVDILDDTSAAYSSVRQSEAVWFSSQLKDTIESSNAWGLVRTLPNQNIVIDVVVAGKLVESNGEVVTLDIQVKDASGQQWFQKQYHQQASSYAYNPELDLPGDPFQAMFNQIANDLFDYRGQLSQQQKVKIHSVAKVRFARDFVPAAFDEYITTTEDGVFDLVRVPADSDPMMQRVERIQARNDLFLDVIQDYYRAFNKKMSLPYEEWRKLSYKEVVYERQLTEQARKEKIAGLMVMVGGLAAASEGGSSLTRGAGHIGVFSGARIFANSFAKRDEAYLHSSTLREMGASLEAELEPNVVDLQDRSVTLSGTVDDQFEEWRRILSRMFEVEQGEISKPETDLDQPDSVNHSEASQNQSVLARSGSGANNVDEEQDDAVNE